MAPAVTFSNDQSPRRHLPLHNKFTQPSTLLLDVQLRKPVVEKMRRDRINSSIEQLRTLLAPEFLNQQPDSKLEKADILEMTISFLRRQEKQPNVLSTSSTAVSEGFSRCVHEVLHFLSKDELRKPVVEKMRRDRINSSIEQLRTLLAPEFLTQQPDSKLEKADILEMTISLLRRQQKQQPVFSTSSTAVSEGFSRCVHEVLHFLSKDEVKTQSQRKLLNHLQNLQPSTDRKWRESDLPLLSSTDQQTLSKEESSVQSALWRPWVTTFPDSVPLHPHHPSTCSSVTGTCYNITRHMAAGHSSLSIPALPLAPNCGNRQQAQDPHIHMEIWEYK
ncbi:hypothetical protein NFI96_004903 [Prochilodus magdalenae]|nr:hypothetical protein NFI96_004903 [Prochilodus magdalenae]